MKIDMSKNNLKETDSELLTDEYMQKKMKQLLDNQEVKNYLKENNKEMIIDMESYRSAGIFDKNIYCLMMTFGIPVRIKNYYDPNGKEVSAEDEDYDFYADHSDYKWIYTPINSMEDLTDYSSTRRFVSFMANRELITPEQERHIAYLLEFANDKRFFNQYTMNKMQSELIDSAPLKYDKAMSIFKKYYTRDVCRKFIYDLGVDKERFLYLSGINYDNFKNKSNRESR